ncbi:winged helix-turn-helix domain-containing protein [Asanoa ferruginea]|uniref:winged helix-turn-helix domain-containing protein n=1 Tax=Asanoa ferruginea TaxID=53367 RepID=UPI000E27A90A
MPARLQGAAAMRALAHPTRIALIEALRLHSTLTATEASSLIGESPTNCAFHLRALARFGFVEEVGAGPGRRRPWRALDVRWRSPTSRTTNSRRPQPGRCRMC